MPEPAHSRELLTTAEARRLLRGAGPRFAAPLRAFIEATNAPAASLAWDQRTLVQNVREASALEAARLLYEGANAALRIDPQVRTLMDTSPGPYAQGWDEVQALAERLDRRLPVAQRVGVGHWPPHVAPGPSADAAHRAAAACVDLADQIAPEWEWTRLMRGIVLMARDSLAEALHVLDELWPSARDEQVLSASVQNSCATLVSLGRAHELESLVSRLEALSGDQAASSYFRLENLAASADAVGCCQALDEMARRSRGQGKVHWMGVLAARAPVLAPVLGVSTADLLARFRELQS